LATLDAMVLLCDRAFAAKNFFGESTMASGNGLMAGKRGVILGVANNRSIAWGIAKALVAEGAELALTYQGEPLKKRVEPLAAEPGATVVGHCDVTDLTTVDSVFAEVEKLLGKIDFVVHEIGRASCRARV